MKKIIAASEKKISAIGSRLIHAAKDKHRAEDDDSEYDPTIRNQRNHTRKVKNN